jgi:hypothetical protein
MTDILLLDDQHPSVTYSGGWFRGGVPGIEYMNTTMYTATPGALATVDFIGLHDTLLNLVPPAHGRHSSRQFNHGHRNTDTCKDN